MIVSVDGVPVSTRQELSDIIGSARPGDVLEVVLERGSDTLVVRPTLADVDAVGVNLAKRNAPVVRDEDDAVTRDPWGTTVRIHPLGA